MAERAERVVLRENSPKRRRLPAKIKLGQIKRQQLDCQVGWFLLCSVKKKTEVHKLTRHSGTQSRLLGEVFKLQSSAWIYP